MFCFKVYFCYFGGSMPFLQHDGARIQSVYSASIIWGNNSIFLLYYYYERATNRKMQFSTHSAGTVWPKRGHIRPEWCRVTICKCVISNGGHAPWTKIYQVGVIKCRNQDVPYHSTRTVRYALKQSWHSSIPYGSSQTKWSVRFGKWLQRHVCGFIKLPENWERRSQIS